MKNNTERKSGYVRVRVSDQQMAYLNMLAKNLRADPGDVLLAFAFGLFEGNEQMHGDKMVEHYGDLLRDFVDGRKVPDADPESELSVNIQQWGRVAVEVPA